MKTIILAPWFLLLASSMAETAVYAGTSAKTTTALGDSLSPNDNHHPKVNNVHVDRLVDWVRSKGGFVSSKVEIRRVKPKDPESRYGVFAKQDIKENDMIFSIPPDCMITSEVEEPNWICDTSANLLREFRRGNESYYAPYVNFLLETQPYGQLPSHWTEDGQNYLLLITGGTRGQDDQEVPPTGPVDWINYEWTNICHGDELDEEGQNAFLTVIQRARGGGNVLVPLDDMLNHRNGHWLNTETTAIEEGQEVQVTTIKPIKAGMELYTSYTHCISCGDRSETMGTGEMVRDYGFVEKYPQRWIFSEEQGFAFELDYNTYTSTGEEDGIVRHGDDLAVAWLIEPSAARVDVAVKFLEQQMNRLDDIRADPRGIPQNEWMVLVQYHNALRQALEYALENLESNQDCSGSEDGQDQTCTVSNSRYDPLDSFEVYYFHTTCDTTKTQNFDDEYVDTEQVRSPYQLISFFEHPKTKDTCFDLDDIYQICTSYRPHYHEMVVHYTARFLPEINRVLWVGGGDSMLLHEILKYPTLEVVIGLELDQKVTRHSFKHFGTQPHWDNPRVQWWYGDAAKSLLMLPKEYFGSFDMVLVDLSETVMSFKVTTGLDIMSALSLLVKPNGIFVKNELYFEKMSPIFKNTLQVHVYDFPVICSQALSLGSRETDFIRGPVKDHGVETMFKQLDNIDHHLSIAHDYEKNPFAHRHYSSADDKQPANQTASPGIIMILEAENSGAALSQGIEEAVSLALGKLGLTIVSTVSSGSIAAFVLKEGYVVARTWTDAKYVAFDIHLFSDFGKMEEIKKSLVEAVGSESPSSFRIVAGGMFGVPGWKRDEMSRGPTFTQECEKDEFQTSRTGSMDTSTVTKALAASISSLANEDAVAVVICGAEGQACPSLDVSKSVTIKKVYPLWTCPGVVGGVDYLQDGAALKFSCEQRVLSTLKSFATKYGKANILVLDPGAKFNIAQIMHKVMSRQKSRNVAFANDLLVLAPVIDKQAWRQLFVKKFVEILPQEPAFFSEILFNNTESTLEMDSFVSGDPFYVEKLSDTTKLIETTTGLVGEIRNIRGGVFGFQHDWTPTQFFEPKDYDQHDPYKQWLSQQPVGHQTVFQFELTDGSSRLSKYIVRQFFDAALAEMKIESAPQEFAGMGEGSMIVTIWIGGSAVALFDGRDHLDLNLFTYHEDVDFATLFSEQFTKSAEVPLKVVLRDEMPRGYGRVVNFMKEITPGKVPSWAQGIKTD